jgi:nucleoside-diphosphate-sugar epimerase
MSPDLVLTGAAGWFGRALLDRVRREPDLIGDGRVRAVVESPAQVHQVLDTHPGAEVLVGDIADTAFVDRVFARTPGALVVHAAGVIHPRRVADFERVNAGGTRLVVASAERAGVRRLVHLSSNSPFGTNPRPDDRFGHDEPYRPYLAYGHSKMAAELAVRAATGLEWTIVRPPWFYGPFQPVRQSTFFTLVRTGRFPLVAPGTQRRSMVHVRNLVDGVLAAADAPEAAGEAFWVADAEPYELSEIVETVRRALHDEGYAVSERALRVPGVVARAAERVDRALQARGAYQQQVHVLGELDKTIACDISHTTRLLGYRPAVSLAEGMRESIRWCRDQGIAL